MRFLTPVLLLLLGCTFSANAKDQFLHRLLEDGGGDDFSPMDGPPCYPCGPNGFTTTPDQVFPIAHPIDNTEMNCDDAHALFVGGSASTEEECAYASKYYNDVCGCASGPTISPAPTVSFIPSSSPTNTAAPTMAICYLCGIEEAGANISWETTVSIPNFGEIPCSILNKILPDSFGDISYGLELNNSCTNIQAYGQECGCSPNQPTVSPAPTASPVPTVRPTTSPIPTSLCSCDGFCDGFNSDCGCQHCDYVCEMLGDCCSDVSDCSASSMATVKIRKSR